MKLKHLLTLGALALCSTAVWAQDPTDTKPSTIEVAANQGTPLPFDDAAIVGNFFDTHESGNNALGGINGTITYSLDVQEEGDYYLYITSGNKGGINHQFTVKVNNGKGIVYGPYDNLGGNWNTYVMDVQKINLPKGTVTLQISVQDDATRWYLGEDYPPYLIPSDHAYILGETSVQIDPLHVWPESTLNFTSVCFGGNDGTKRKPYRGNNEASLLASDKCPSNDQTNYSFYPKSKLYYPVNLTKGGLYPIEINGTFYTVNNAVTDGYTIVVSDENGNMLGEINNFTNGIATGTLKIDSSNIEYLVFTAEGSSNVIYMMSGISIDKPSNLLLTLNDVEETIYENAEFTVTGTYVADGTPTIKIYTDDEENGEEATKEDDGTFSYTFKNGLEAGEHIIKAEATLDDGTTSSAEIQLAVYENDHTFYISINGAENGSVSATVEGSTVEASDEGYPVEIGKNITFTFTPNPGYEFVSASSSDFDVKPEISEGVGTVTVSNVQNDGTIKVVFDEEKITIDGNISGNGYMELHYAEGSSDKYMGDIKSSETYKVEKGKNIRIYFKANGEKFKDVNIAQIIMTQGEKVTDITDIAWRNMNWQQPIYLIESISENTTFDVYFEKVLNSSNVADKGGFANEFVTINVPEESAEYGTVTVKRWSATSDSESELMTLAVNGNGTIDLPGYITENTELAITVTPNPGSTISKFEIEHGETITPEIENNSVAFTHKLTVSQPTLTVTADFEKNNISDGYYLANSMTTKYGGAFVPNPSYKFEGPYSETQNDVEVTFYTLTVGNVSSSVEFFVIDVKDGINTDYSNNAYTIMQPGGENNWVDLIKGDSSHLSLDNNYVNVTFTLTLDEGAPFSLYYIGEVNGDDWYISPGNDQTMQSGTVSGNSIELATASDGALVYIYVPSTDKNKEIYYTLTKKLIQDDGTATNAEETSELIPANLQTEGESTFFTVGVQKGYNGEIKVYTTDSSEDAVATFSYSVSPTATPTVVEVIETEEGKAEYYSLQGVKVTNPEKGIFIKVLNGKASKVILK